MCEDRITPALNEVLACVVERFADCGAAGFCRVGVVAGEVAWDDCCDCGKGDGQLWVRVATWTPDPEFPDPRPDGCAQPSLLTIGVGSLRCVPGIDEAGHPPSAADEARAAARTYSDAQLIFDGVMCCGVERNWAGWAPLGYDGGCGGGEHIFTIPFYPCRCGQLTSP